MPRVPKNLPHSFSYHDWRLERGSDNEPQSAEGSLEDMSSTESVVSWGLDNVFGSVSGLAERHVQTENARDDNVPALNEGTSNRITI